MRPLADPLKQKGPRWLRHEGAHRGPL